MIYGVYDSIYNYTKWFSSKEEALNYLNLQKTKYVYDQPLSLIERVIK